MLDGLVLPLGLVDYVLVDLVVSTWVEFLVFQYLVGPQGWRGLKLVLLVNLGSLLFGVGVHLWMVWQTILEYPGVLVYIWPQILWLDQEIWLMKGPTYAGFLVSSPLVTFFVTLVIEGILLYYLIPRMIPTGSLGDQPSGESHETVLRQPLAYYLLPMNVSSYVAFFILVPLYVALSIVPGLSGALMVVVFLLFLRKYDMELSAS